MRGEASGEVRSRISFSEREKTSEKLSEPGLCVDFQWQGTTKGRDPWSVL